MITASFFILASALPPPSSGRRIYGSLALTLLDGDAKNDRRARHIERIIVAEHEGQLVSYLGALSRDQPTSIIAVLGFTHRHVTDIKAAAVRASAALFAINYPGQRHPAAMVAVADRTMRVRPHHLYYSDGRDAPLSTYTTCAANALTVL